MKHKILYLLAFLLITVCSCSSDDAVEAGAPTVQFPLSELNVDLNTVDNLPIIAVIKSEAGLAQVNVDIKSEDGLVHFKSITDFYNVHNYSLAESPEYKVGYTSVVVEAIDLQGKKVSAEMPITVKDIISRPVVTFENDEILYDEMDENAVMPRTKFTVQAEGGLKLVEIFRVFKGGQEKLASINKNGETTYDFDDLINYTENDKAIKIVASDSYNNATVATLPVVYKIVPVPVVTVPAEPVFAESAKDVNIPVTIDAIRGLKNVKLYKVEDGEETLPHVNSKGILGLDRSEKDAYLYYKAMLSEKPSLYIGGKDWKYRTSVSDAQEARMDVPVFAKAEKVTIYRNQKLIGSFATKDGVAMVSVPFVDGENKIVANAEINGEKVSDAINVQMRIIPASFSEGFPASGLHVTCGDLRYMEDKEESMCWMPEKPYQEGSWGYVGGSIYRRSGDLLGTDADILGTDKDPIYQTQRQDIEAFKADVPNGEYIVTLHFASLKEAAALVYNLSAQNQQQKTEGESVFDVNINGETVLESFNPSYCGMSRAVAKRINVLVKNGKGLDIQFQPKKGKTTLNAIEIYKR